MPAEPPVRPAEGGDRFIGLMSGTSLDGVDGVLLQAQPAGGWAVTESVHLDLAAPLRAELLALNRSGPNELHRAALAANALMGHYAQAVGWLLQRQGLPPSTVRAIGAHGQTVRHQPASPGQRPDTATDWTAYTLQLGNPALLAELTGIAVVADFRSRDVAAGGHVSAAKVGHHGDAGQFGQQRGVAQLQGVSGPVGGGVRALAGGRGLVTDRLAVRTNGPNGRWRQALPLQQPSNRLGVVAHQGVGRQGGSVQFIGAAAVQGQQFCAQRRGQVEMDGFRHRPTTGRLRLQKHAVHTVQRRAGHQANEAVAAFSGAHGRFSGHWPR